MENYFNKYKLAKLTLAKMAAQFYDCTISIADAEQYGIKYNNYDYRRKSVNCCFNRFEPSGEYIWEALGIEEPIIAYDELWDIIDAIKNEKESNKISYQEEYLKMSICALGMIIKFYGQKIPVEEIENLKYDKEFDEYDGLVDTYYHLFESAGESAWELFGFDEPRIPSSEVYAKQKQLTSELLKLSKKSK